MTMRNFIKNNREQLDSAIKGAMCRYDKPGFQRKITLNDDERRGWILNDEGLYNWAKSEGVNV